MYPQPCSPSLQNPTLSLVFPRTSLKNRPFCYTRNKFSVTCKRSEYYEQRKFSSSNESSSSRQPLGALPPRVFVGYSIYKGKAALTVDPKAPEFVPLDSGAYKVSKEGFILLQFAPAAGLRQYDWSRKQVFSLSIAEIGSLMGLGAKDSCEFFHDPFKGKSEEGQVRKLLRIEPLPDGSGHFFNLRTFLGDTKWNRLLNRTGFNCREFNAPGVQNRLLNVDESIYIPISKAEFTVLVSAFNFIVPYLLGWNAFGNTIRPDESVRTNNASPRSGVDFEWGR